MIVQVVCGCLRLIFSWCWVVVLMERVCYLSRLSQNAVSPASEDSAGRLLRVCLSFLLASPWNELCSEDRVGVSNYFEACASELMSLNELDKLGVGQLEVASQSHVLELVAMTWCVSILDLHGCGGTYIV